MTQAKTNREQSNFSSTVTQRISELECLATESPAVLTVGTRIDRFGLSDGRIFTSEGVSRAQHPVPAGHLTAGYRRYLVTTPLTVWRAALAGHSDQVAGGVRYRSDLPVAELITAGYLREVTREAHIVTP